MMENNVEVSMVNHPKLRSDLLGKRRFVWFSFIFALVALLGASGWALREKWLGLEVEHLGDSAAQPPNTVPLKVKAIRPSHVGDLSLSVEQLGVIEPYYRADLRARASGIVRAISGDIGDRVRKGDVLVELDVPELVEEVARAEKLVDQRRQEKRVAEAKLNDTLAAKRVAAATVKQKLADAEGVEATRNLRRAKLVRYRDLAAKGTVVGSVVEEEERDYLAAESSLASAQAAVERARADLDEMDSKIDAAKEEVALREVMIDVAQKEYQRAVALADNARVFAPFDGVIVQRSIDPGSFVQNASTGNSEPLISVAVIDTVTVSARFPDSVAPYVELGAKCEVIVDDLNLRVSADVTRFAPLVQSSDRSIRVEVDLFNGTQESLDVFLVQKAHSGEAGQTKGAGGKLPSAALEPTDPNKRILPGMTGRLKLKIGKFGESYMLPSQTLYTRSGQSYVLLVVDGKTVERSVKVQLNDGNLARVALVEPDSNRLKELDGSEVLVLGKQLEIGSNRAVEAVFGSSE